MRHAWLGGHWAHDGRVYRLSDDFLRRAHGNPLVTKLCPLLKAAKLGHRLEPGVWRVRQYRYGSKTRKPLTHMPDGRNLDGLREFFQSELPHVNLELCSFRYPRLLEKAHEGRRHVLRVGDSATALWCDDRKGERKFVKSYLLVEELIEVTVKPPVSRLGTSPAPLVDEVYSRIVMLLFGLV